MKWLADENFRSAITRGIRRRSPHFDVVRVQDQLEIAGQSDKAILAWATEENGVLLTHDLATMVPAMRPQLERLGDCSPMVLVLESLAARDAIEDILLLNERAVDSDWAAGVLYLPIRCVLPVACTLMEGRIGASPPPDAVHWKRSCNRFPAPFPILGSLPARVCWRSGLS